MSVERYRKMMDAALDCVLCEDYAGAQAALNWRGLAKERRGRKSKYPWDTVEIGGGFVIAGRPWESVQAHASGAGKRYGKLYKCVAEIDGPEGLGILVERIG